MTALESRLFARSFNSEALSTIVENHHAFFGGSPDGLPTGEAIPLGARILTIADAYDAIVSDRVYRKGRTQEEAFAELRRCAGTQFDPKLVEIFIEMIKRRHTGEENLPKVSRQSALNICQQIERLASAVDDQDLDGLQTLAGRLQQTAEMHGMEEIALKADELKVEAISEDDLIDILTSANELLTMCRTAQRSYIDQSNNSVRETIGS